MKFWRNDAIEALALERLQQLEQVLGRPISAPVPIDRIAEAILELDFLWDEIEELEGEVILGAIRPHQRLILLNEKRRKLFEEKAGLEHFTKGHEMGHWDLFVDKSVLDHPELFDRDASGVSSFRHSKAGGVWVLQSACREPEGQELVRRVMSRVDRGDEARAVNRYAGAILMPQQLLRADVEVRRPRGWPELYRMREKYNVTISALTVRLQQLDQRTYTCRLCRVGTSRPREGRDVSGPALGTRFGNASSMRTSASWITARRSSSQPGGRLSARRLAHAFTSS